MKAKESKKELKAQLTNEISKRFKTKILNLESDVMHFKTLYIEECKKRTEFENKYNELLEKFQQYEDWNIRLQEFVNMTPEDRDRYIEENKINKETQERFNKMMNTYNHIMGLMF